MGNDQLYKLVGDNHYRNGERLRTGATFVPTESELENVGFKLEPVESDSESESGGSDSDATDDTADDGSESEADEPDEFDDSELEGAKKFVDRTPMSDVVEDIEAGKADDHLDAVAHAESELKDRKGVHEAIDGRRDELETESED